MINASEILAARILIVDDMPVNVALLTEFLGNVGYLNVTSTCDPFAVCELHRTHDFDLILLDLQMPGMDGFQVMQQLQQMQSGGYLPVLVITAQPGQKLRALSSGAKDFIAKPFDLLELKTRIHNMLEVRLLYKQLEHAVGTLQSYALHDPLTKLPNRRLLMDRLDQARRVSASSKHHCALMFLDIDHFKQLNDTLGHDMGDDLLQQVSARLLGCVRVGDSVARFGGDEFVVLLDGLSCQAQEAATQTKGVAHSMLRALGQTYPLGASSYAASLSIGAVVFQGELEATGELLKKADLAMYQAKSDGRATARLFDPALQAQLQAHEALAQALRSGVLQQAFVLSYQPQVDKQGLCIGAEALYCWNHPTRGVQQAPEFWPLAEETGVDVALSQWALETTCQQLQAWAKAAHTAHLTITLKLSAGQFAQPDFVATLNRVLQTSVVNPQLLVLALTEDMVSDQFEKAMVTMDAIVACGVRLALDEFGVGFSSLSQLKRLPLTQLKIAPTFVHTMLADAPDAAVTRTIVTLGHSLGLQVMAAGVQNAAQHAFLLAVDCDAFQGDLFDSAGEP